MNRKCAYGIIGGLLLVAAGAVWLQAKPITRRSIQTNMPIAMQVATTPTVGVATATPALITANTPTTVTVTVQITDSRLLPNGVSLLRLNSDGSSTILGVMHDDGLNGDASANDNIFSLNVNFNEPTVGQIQLQVSAAFKGLLKRVLSPMLPAQVWQKLSSPSATISFAYPSIANTPNPVVTTTADGTLVVDVPTKQNALLLPILSITLAGANGTTPLTTWFVQNVDTNQLLSADGVYTLLTLPDGRAVLSLTGGIPDEWDGGPLPQAYVMSSDKTQVAIVQLSQDDPLSDYGITSQQVSNIVDAISQTISFN